MFEIDQFREYEHGNFVLQMSFFGPSRPLDVSALGSTYILSNIPPSRLWVLEGNVMSTASQNSAKLTHNEPRLQFAVVRCSLFTFVEQPTPLNFPMISAVIVFLVLRALPGNLELPVLWMWSSRSFRLVSS